jgi:hypothetical protein
VEEEPLDLLAASLRADSTDTRSLIEALAAKLESALPTQTTIDRKAARLFSNKKRVESVKVVLGENTYELSIAGDTAKPTRRKTVGGIAIRNENLSLDEWLSGLTHALSAEAGRSEAARIALEQLLR